MLQQVDNMTTRTADHASPSGCDAESGCSISAGRSCTSHSRASTPAGMTHSPTAPCSTSSGPDGERSSCPTRAPGHCCWRWGEAVLGTALLLGGTAARWGYAGVIAFHVALMLFGWGFWMWSVPALVFLVWLARRDWPLLDQPTSPDRTGLSTLISGRRIAEPGRQTPSEEAAMTTRQPSSCCRRRRYERWDRGGRVRGRVRRASSRALDVAPRLPPLPRDQSPSPRRRSDHGPTRHHRRRLPALRRHLQRGADARCRRGRSRGGAPCHIEQRFPHLHHSREARGGIGGQGTDQDVAHRVSRRRRPQSRTLGRALLRGIDEFRRCRARRLPGRGRADELEGPSQGWADRGRARRSPRRGGRPRLRVPRGVADRVRTRGPPCVGASSHLAGPTGSVHHRPRSGSGRGTTAE